jgi:uncharacterized membrane protein
MPLDAPDSGIVSLCSGGELRVQDLTGGELGRAHEALGGPGRPVFVEVVTEAMGRGRGAEGASGELGASVVELVRASPVGESAGCSEPPALYRVRASGNEPFWSATVEEDSIVFEQPADPSRVAAPIVGREEHAGRLVYRAEGSGGDGSHLIRVTLTKGRCADSMSGALYSFSAEVVFDGRSLTGCGRTGELAGAR